MGVWFTVLTIVFIIVSAAMVLIILVQRPQGGGLAGAFGGAGGSGSDTVFGGRVGDALTLMTVFAFVVYLSLAISLNLMDSSGPPPGVQPAVSATDTDPAGGGTVPLLPADLPFDLGNTPTTPPGDTGDSPIDGGPDSGGGS